MTKPNRLNLLLLGLVLLLAGLGWSVFLLGTQTETIQTETMRILTTLTSAEAAQDSDALQVVSLQLPHYDEVVTDSQRVDRLRHRLAELMAEPPYRDNAALRMTARDYLEQLGRKAELLESLKSNAAFLRNQIAYVPFAITQTAPHLKTEQSLALLVLGQKMLSYHAYPTEEVRQAFLTALDTPGALAESPETAPLLRHMRVYFQERESLLRAMADYSVISADSRMPFLREAIIGHHDTERRQIVLGRSLLTVLAALLVIALTWTMLSLNRARQTAEKASSRMTDAIQNMSGAFALYDSNHRLVTHNSQWFDYFAPLANKVEEGIRFEDMIEMMIRSGFVAWAEPDPRSWADQRIAAAGTAEPSLMQTAAGRWYLCSDARTSDGGVLCVYTDLTALKQAEDRLQRLSTAVEQSPASIVITDTAGNIQYVNPWFCSTTGYTAEDVLGQNPRLLKSGQVLETDYKTLWDTISRGEVWSGELCNKRKDGSLYWERASISPIRDGLGHITAYVGVKTDITEQRDNAQKMQSMLDELERSNAELEQFAYVASHDLREPLRMVASYVSLLARRYSDKLDGDALDFIAFAKDGARRMDRLILDLLDYSRIGRANRQPEPVSLSDSFDEARLNLEGVIADSHTSLIVPAQLPTVMGDRGELTRLFQNLLGNAIKYRDPARNPEIKISAHQKGGMWELSVSDNGIGIAPEYHEKVFGIFQRLHGRQEYEGTGIGLAICRKIVQHHGGRIWVETQQEPGARFVFTLPKEG